MLPYLLAGVLVALWMLDAVFTVQVLKKKGDKKEANKLMRVVYRRGTFSFFAFKIIAMSFVVAVLLLMSEEYTITAESVMFVFIYIYAKVDWHNYKIWMNRNNKTKSKGNKKDLKISGNR